jgi:hypothetical protein
MWNNDRVTSASQRETQKPKSAVSTLPSLLEDVWRVHCPSGSHGLSRLTWGIGLVRYPVLGNTSVPCQWRAQTLAWLRVMLASQRCIVLYLYTRVDIPSNNFPPSGFMSRRKGVNRAFPSLILPRLRYAMVEMAAFVKLTWETGCQAVVYRSIL